MSKKDNKVAEAVVEETEEKKYIVNLSFKDLEDNDKVYLKGNSYPRPANKKVSAARIKALSSKNNKIGEQLIKELG